jgi:hypothetical protein
MGQPPPHRALLLLGAVYPEASPETLATFSIGRRDAALLSLRERLFGPQLTSVVNCPQCGERLELAFAVSDIHVDGEPEGEGPPVELSLTVGEYRVRFRLPHSLDLLAVVEEQGSGKARTQVLHRCVLEVEHDGKTQAVDKLPDEVIDGMMERMAEADPQADVQLTLTCPECAHAWQAPFDIVSYLWAEIDTWAYRILRQVHTLALAYGWREADVLALSPWRRRFYLDMVGS